MTKKIEGAVIGRPKTKDPRRMVGVYLKTREWDRLAILAKESDMTKSQIIEKLLIKSFYQKFQDK